MNSPYELTRKEIELTLWHHVESALEPIDNQQLDAFANDAGYAAAIIHGFTRLEGTTPLGNELSVLINWVCCGEKSRYLPGLWLYHPSAPDLTKRPGLILMDYAIVRDAAGDVLSTNALLDLLATSTWSSKWLAEAIASLPTNPTVKASRCAPLSALAQTD